MEPALLQIPCPAPRSRQRFSQPRLLLWGAGHVGGRCGLGQTAQQRRVGGADPGRQAWKEGGHLSARLAAATAQGGRGGRRWQTVWTVKGGEPFPSRTRTAWAVLYPRRSAPGAEMGACASSTEPTGAEADGKPHADQHAADRQSLQRDASTRRVVFDKTGLSGDSEPLKVLGWLYELQDGRCEHGEPRCAAGRGRHYSSPPARHAATPL